MMRLAEEFFAAKSDPSQLLVTEEVLERLRQIHPATLSEETNANGPVAWILLIPTTQDVMEKFIAKEINERELFEKSRRTEVTAQIGRFDAVYLCSALVLPEQRGKGLAKRLTVEAIRSIRKDHPIKALFYWGFSPEGADLAASVARATKLPLRKREE